MKRKIGIAAVVVSLLLALIMVWLLDFPNWKTLDTQLLENLQDASIVYDREGNEAFSLYGTQRRRSVSVDELPEYVVQAFVAAEDQRFYSHNGIDIRRILGAAWNNLRSGSLDQGASTITQQLIKLTHLSSEKTFRRKIQEARLAMEAERIYTKDEIMEMYINVIYFGKGAYGIEAAANEYFGKSARELSISEAAMLAGIIKSPNRYSPANSMELAVRRRDYVLDEMKECGFIDEAEHQQAEAEPIRLTKKESAGLSGWYRDAVITEACSRLGVTPERLCGGGYRIYTGLDPAMQQMMDGCMADEAAFPASGVEGAMIALDPADGSVRALSGGRNDDLRMAMNRVTDARRQPGSVIKPVSVYAAAIDSGGYLPSDFVDDTQRVFADGYMPRNAGGQYYGKVSLRTALSRSLNVAAVSLADSIGIASVRNYARRFGIPVENDDASLAFALGSMTYGMTPMETAGAYAALANGGKSVEPHLITRILDGGGQEVYVHEDASERIISRETAYLLIDMLKSVVQDGSARALNGIGMPIAAKTGTVSGWNGTRDAWIAACTPDISLCVWMGYDSEKVGVMEESVSGSGYPARMAARWLQQIAAHLGGTDWSMPESLDVAELDRIAYEQDGAVLLAGEHTPADERMREVFPLIRMPEDVSQRCAAPFAVADAEVSADMLGRPKIRFRVQQPGMEYLIMRHQDGEIRCVATLTGSPGEVLEYLDAGASQQSEVIYQIIVRQPELYGKGTLLAEGSSVTLRFLPMLAMEPSVPESATGIRTASPLFVP